MLQLQKNRNPTMKEQTEQVWNKESWSITKLQEFVRNYGN